MIGIRNIRTVQKDYRVTYLTIGGISLILLFMMDACSITFKKQSQFQKDSVEVRYSPDLLKIIYSIADQKGLKVISDVNMAGGGWYGKISAQEMADSMKQYIDQYSNRYGNYKSFYGWYLNNEINPIRVDQTAQSNFWREVWKAAVEECHSVKPGSRVTISPFFLLDKNEYRGFKYLQPSEYEQWWGTTLKETGIDILMLQDSGAGHLSFFTLSERRPFFEAFAKACKYGGAELWMNVETGQVDAKNWNDAIKMEKAREKKWVFTPIDWLAQKLQLAAQYGSGIVNWGYFPLMNPVKGEGPWPIGEVDGQEISFADQMKAYNDYVNYYKNMPKKKMDNEKCLPMINGTLWMLRANYKDWTEKELRKVITQQLDAQQKAGFTILWITNTPRIMKLATSVRR